MRFVEPVRGPGQMVRPPGIEPDRVRQGGKACKLNDPRQSKRTPRPNGRPHEKPPRGCQAFGRCALEPSRLPGNLPASGRGMYGDSIALDQKSRRRRGAPPPAALDGISIARFFGSKVQCSEQAEIFCDFPDKIPVPLLGSPLRDIEPQGCTKYSV